MHMEVAVDHTINVKFFLFIKVGDGVHIFVFAKMEPTRGAGEQGYLQPSSLLFNPESSMWTLLHDVDSTLGGRAGKRRGRTWVRRASLRRLTDHYLGRYLGSTYVPIEKSSPLHFHT
jgi:hypothetical protein